MVYSQLNYFNYLFNFILVMIETINPKYKISNQEYGFKQITSDISKAKEIEDNLKKSIDFVKTLTKYHNFQENDRSNKNLSRNSFIEFKFTNDGKLESIIVDIHETIYDNWDGRPPIKQHYENKKTIEDLVVLASRIKENIIEVIQELETINSTYSNKILRNIFEKEWNVPEKIKELEKDIEKLNY